jgi:hypothetical protein
MRPTHVAFAANGIGSTRAQMRGSAHKSLFNISHGFARTASFEADSARILEAWATVSGGHLTHSDARRLTDIGCALKARVNRLLAVITGRGRSLCWLGTSVRDLIVTRGQQPCTAP